MADLVIGSTIAGYRDRRADRAGRDGRRLPGDPPGPGTAGGAEGDRPRAGRARRLPRALPARVAARRPPRPPGGGADLRLARGRRRAGRGDAAGRWRRPAQADRPRGAAAAGAGDRPARARSPKRSTPPTPPASSTATSSRTTSWSKASAPSSPTSASPRRSTRAASTAAPRSSAPPSTCRPSSGAAAPSARAADVYSLGCVLFEALTGVAPFARKEADTEPEMPEGLDAVIERAVAADPRERYPSAGAMIAAARERQGGEPTATRVLSEPSGPPGLGARDLRTAALPTPTAVAGRSRPAVARSPMARLGWRFSRRWSSSSSRSGRRRRHRRLEADRGRQPRRCGSPPARTRSGSPANPTAP